MDPELTSKESLHWLLGLAVDLDDVRYRVHLSHGWLDLVDKDDRRSCRFTSLQLLVVKEAVRTQPSLPIPPAMPERSFEHKEYSQSRLQR